MPSVPRSDVPVSPEDVLATAKDTYNLVLSLVDSESAKIAVIPFAALAGGLIFVAAAVVMIAVRVIFAIAPLVATTFLKIFGAAKKENQGGINEVIAEILAEVLSVQIAPEEIPTGGDIHGQLARSVTIGSKFHEALIKLFAPGGNVTPETGEKAAQAFTGYTLNNAVSSSLIGIFAELQSLGHFKEFGKVGEDAANNLGLARLHRQALGPLIRNAVAEPYDQLLKKRYRPDRLSDAQYVRAFHRGGISESELNDQLATKGYTDRDIRQIVLELTARLTDTDLARLVRWGVIDFNLAVASLNAAGIPKDTAEKQLRSTLLTRADSTMGQYLNKIENAYIEGFIDEFEFQKLFARLPLGEDERQWELNLVGIQKDIPRKKLTLAQVKDAYLNALVTLDYVDVYLEAEGYSDDDALIIEYLLLIDANEKTEKEQLAKDRKKRAADRAAAAAQRGNS